MKLWLLILLLFQLASGFAQISYTSRITIHFPSEETEFIDRQITFAKNAVTIVTDINNGKDIQNFEVIALDQKNYINVGLSDIVICSSGSGTYATYFIMPATIKVEFIDVYQPAQLGQPERLYRFLVD